MAMIFVHCTEIWWDSVQQPWSLYDVWMCTAGVDNYWR